MILDFNQYANEGNAFLRELSRELGYSDDEGRAAHVFRATVHTLRDIIPMQESLQMLSQLPMFLKAVYVDGWTSKKSPDIHHMDDFFERMRERERQSPLQNMSNDELDRLVPVVFLVLRKYVSLGELEDLKAVLPKELKHMVDPVSMM